MSLIRFHTEDIFDHVIELEVLTLFPYVSKTLRLLHLTWCYTELEMTNYLRIRQ